MNLPFRAWQGYTFAKEASCEWWGGGFVKSEHGCRGPTSAGGDIPVHFPKVVSFD